MKPSCELARATLGKRASGFSRYILSAAVPLWLSLAAVPAQVPQLLNYQGRVQVGTSDFNGTGQFKFALVNGAGTTTYWSNDGTLAGQPASSVTLPVTKGLYAVRLGNTALPNMIAVPPAAFANGDVHLRVWFNDGVNGFQQFVPDQRVAAAAYALNAANAVTAGSLTGSISVDQLPPGVLRETNGTTTISGNVVVQGTLTAAGVASPTAVGSSGLPAGTTFEVLIDNIVEPGVRVEEFSRDGVKLRRPTTDLSWNELFQRRGGSGANTGTNVPVSLRLTLANGGIITWTIVDGVGALKPTFVPEFWRAVGSDFRPYDYVYLKMGAAEGGGDGYIVRSNLNISASGSPPRLDIAGPVSGQPGSSSMRLNLDGVSHNNVVFASRIYREFEGDVRISLNPTFHTALSAWALGEEPIQRSAEIVLVSGLPGTLTLLAQTPPGVTVFPKGYSLHFAADGLPVEFFSITSYK